MICVTINTYFIRYQSVRVYYFNKFYKIILFCRAFNAHTYSYTMSWHIRIEQGWALGILATAFATSLDSSSSHFITLFNCPLLSVSIVNVTGKLFAKLVLMCHGIKGNGTGERCCPTRKKPQKERLAAEQVEGINTSLESEISLSGSSC